MHSSQAGNNVSCSGCGSVFAHTQLSHFYLPCKFYQASGNGRMRGGPGDEASIVMQLTQRTLLLARHNGELPHDLQAGHAYECNIAPALAYLQHTYRIAGNFEARKLS